MKLKKEIRLAVISHSSRNGSQAVRHMPQSVNRKTYTLGLREETKAKCPGTEMFAVTTTMKVDNLNEVRRFKRQDKA